MLLTGLRLCAWERAWESADADWHCPGPSWCMITLRIASEDGLLQSRSNTHRAACLAWPTSGWHPPGPKLERLSKAISPARAGHGPMRTLLARGGGRGASGRGGIQCPAGPGGVPRGPYWPRRVWAGLVETAEPGPGHWPPPHLPHPCAAQAQAQAEPLAGNLKTSLVSPAPWERTL